MYVGNYTALYYHIVFSTKGRKPLLTPNVQPRLYAYLQHCSKSKSHSIIKVNGMSDHIHILLIAYSGNFVISNFVREIKKSTNKFLNTAMGMNGSFAWQDGYFVSTVSKRDVAAICRYIEMQQEHHSKFDIAQELEIIFRLNDDELR